ncbi:MAG TPA: class I SAM-dependent methyltransferase [Burkholderiales bacterium]|nr:class I SAM-dependent methyltransferase [Burkholderiales bacterium]
MRAFEFTEFRSREAFGEYLNGDPAHAERQQFEAELVAGAGDVEAFRFEAWCAACESEKPLLVDRLHGAVSLPDGWLPNWRERISCPDCGMNNRQRAIIHALGQTIAERRAAGRGAARLYAIEQVSPFFHWLESHLPIKCVGSEYLGAQSGWHRWIRFGWRRVRHEDVEALRFGAGRFDFVVANDVLEHVNEPRKAIGEICRVLRPDGELYISVPFMPGEQSSRRRALLAGGEVQHLLPAEYHPNPLSASGSLVFHDFGWDLLEWLREAGFGDACMRAYWSRECGYLGDPQFYFHAIKPGAGNR